MSWHSANMIKRYSRGSTTTLINTCEQLCCITKNLKESQCKRFSAQLQSILFVLPTNSLTISKRSVRITNKFLSKTKKNPSQDLFAACGGFCSRLTKDSVRSLRTNLFAIQLICFVICEEVLCNAMHSNLSQIANDFFPRI